MWCCGRLGVISEGRAIANRSCVMGDAFATYVLRFTRFWSNYARDRSDWSDLSKFPRGNYDTMVGRDASKIARATVLIGPKFPQGNYSHKNVFRPSRGPRNPGDRKAGDGKNRVRQETVSYAGNVVVGRLNVGQC